MEPTVPNAKEAILRLLTRTLSNPAFAPVHLVAKLPNVDAQTIGTDIVRVGESLWHGGAYHGQMEGTITTYPRLDLTLFPWDFNERVSFASVRSGDLCKALQMQIDEELAIRPFWMCPVDDGKPWKEDFLSKSLDRPIRFKLSCEGRAPEWVKGLDALSMAGTWKAFLPLASPEELSK